MFEFTHNQLNFLLDGKKVGYILFDVKETYVAGSYVYVDPNERGKGYAQMLIKRFVEFAQELNLKILPICPVIKRNLELQYPEIIK